MGLFNRGDRKDHREEAAKQMEAKKEVGKFGHRAGERSLDDLIKLAKEQQVALIKKIQSGEIDPLDWASKETAEEITKRSKERGDGTPGDTPKDKLKEEAIYWLEEGYATGWDDEANSELGRLKGNLEHAQGQEPGEAERRFEAAKERGTVPGPTYHEGYDTEGIAETLSAEEQTAKQRIVAEMSKHFSPDYLRNLLA